MARKQHHEEISGPDDLTQSAPLAKDLPRPKGARILSRKALENRAQNQSTQVPSSASPIPTIPISTAKSTTVKSSPTAGIDTSASKRRQPSQAQNSSKRKRENRQNTEEEEEWERQYKSTQKKADKLKILLEHIGPVRPYPEKLKVPTPAGKGCPFPRIPFVFDPLELFLRFIPRKQFDTIAQNTNEYARREAVQDSRRKTQWKDVIGAEIGAFLGATLLIGAQPGGRNLPYHWNTYDDLPSFPIAKYISRDRFRLIARYIKINEPGDLSNE